MSKFCTKGPFINKIVFTLRITFYKLYYLKRKTRHERYAVEFICCVINSDYDLKAIYNCFAAGIFTKDYLHNLPLASITAYIISIYLKFGEAIVECLVCKLVFDFPPPCFYYFFMYKVFSIPVKNTN